MTPPQENRLPNKRLTMVRFRYRLCCFALLCQFLSYTFLDLSQPKFHVSQTSSLLPLVDMIQLSVDHECHEESLFGETLLIRQNTTANFYLPKKQFIVRRERAS